MGKLGWDVVGLETAGDDDTYAWNVSSARDDGPRVVTGFKARKYNDLGKREMRRVLGRLLDDLKPDAIAIAGWSLTDSSSCLDWCKRSGSLAIVMSETREVDGHRVWWKEFLKSRVIRGFDAALVGGMTHRDYLVKLGMPAARIAFGYNVVDNAYFKAEAAKFRCSGGPVDGFSAGASPDQPRTKNQEPRTNKSPPYFLASNRFIERKNLARLVEAYAEYLKSAYESGARVQQDPEPGTGNQEHRPWDLCLLGDGELKASLIAQCHALGLTVIESAPWETAPTPDSRPAISVLSPPTSDLRPPSSGSVFFPGFRQIEELPRFYAHAGCFVHPALEEPWGLVLNEAMACSLPVLSSNNVGAAEELIDEWVNGWTFEAENSADIAECLQRIAGLNDGERTAMGCASARILEERCPTEAFGRGLAELLDVSVE
jgi:1,2-diacylglycerol 3-alpha-glucosyltransferase